MVPQFMLYTDLKWTNTYLPLMVPPFLSYGVRGGILLIVFRQFFRGLPYELEDAAHVDGAGPFRIFWQIMLPLAKTRYPRSHALFTGVDLERQLHAPGWCCATIHSTR